MGVVFLVLAVVCLGGAAYGWQRHRLDRDRSGLLLAAAGAGAGGLFLLIGGWFKLLLVLLAGVLLAVVYAARKWRVSWGRPAAVACAAIILLVALVRLAVGLSGCRGGSELRGQDRAIRSFAAVQGAYLGGWIAAKWPGKRVLVITEHTDGIRGESITALREALAAAGSPVLDTTVLGIYDPMIFQADPKDLAADGIDVSRYAREPFTQKVLAQLLRAHPAAVVVSYAGLPTDTLAKRVPRKESAPWVPEELPYGPLWQWPTDKLPELVLVESTRYVWPEAVERGLVDAVVVGNPAYERAAAGGEARAPDDLAAAFAQRYLLIEPDNVALHTDRLPHP